MDPPVAIGAGTSEAKESVFSSPATFECQGEEHRRRRPHPHRPGTMWQRVQVSGPGLARCLGNSSWCSCWGWSASLCSPDFLWPWRWVATGCGAGVRCVGRRTSWLVASCWCQGRCVRPNSIWGQYWRLSPHTVSSSPGAVLGLCGPLPGAHDPFCSSLPGVLEVFSR